MLCEEDSPPRDLSSLNAGEPVAPLAPDVVPFALEGAYQFVAGFRDIRRKDFNEEYAKFKADMGRGPPVTTSSSKFVVTTPDREAELNTEIATAAATSFAKPDIEESTPVASFDMQSPLGSSQHAETSDSELTRLREEIRRMKAEIEQLKATAQVHSEASQDRSNLQADINNQIQTSFNRLGNLVSKYQTETSAAIQNLQKEVNYRADSIMAIADEIEGELHGVVNDRLGNF
jgi:Skp family chaperone for outer membrane proteins